MRVPDDVQCVRFEALRSTELLALSRGYAVTCFETQEKAKRKIQRVYFEKHMLLEA